LILFIIVNVPLLFYFWDYFNLNTIIYSSSYLYLGINPYFPGSNYVAAYLTTPYNLMAFIFYFLSGYSPSFTYISLKIFGLMIIFFTGFFLIKHAKSYSGTNKALLLSTIVLDPFILINNDISISTVFIPLLFTFLSVYFIFGKDSDDDLHLVAGIVSLFIAGFTYYFPLLIFPSLLFFLPSNARRLKFISLSIIIGFIFYLPVTLFHLSSSFTGTLLGGSPSLYPYSVLNLLPISAQRFVLMDQILVTSLIIGSAVIFPLAFKKFGFGVEFSTVFVFLFSLLLQPNGTYPDSFLIVVPFEILILSRSQKRKFSYLYSIIPQLFMIPMLIIGQMLNGPGYVTGIYYSLYTAIHQNIVLYNIIPDALFVWKLLLLFSIILSVIGLIILAREDLSDQIRKEKQYLKLFSPVKRKKNKRIIMAVFLLMILFFLVVPTIFSSNAPNTNSIKSSSTFPALIFTPVSGDGVFVMPSPSTYSYSGRNVTFEPQSGLLYLQRITQNEYIDLNFTLSGYNNTLAPASTLFPVLSSNVFSVSIIDSIVPINYSVNSTILHSNASRNSLANHGDIISCAKLLRKENYSLYGASAGASVSTNFTEFPIKSIVVEEINNGKSFVLPYLPSENFKIVTYSSGTMFTVDNVTFDSPVLLKEIEFGKLTNSRLELLYSFSFLEFTSAHVVPNYLIIILSASLIAPASGYLIFPWYFRRYIKTTL